ncbi:MAG: DivIVA domain-containing protein, partial [Candidatus Avispirillum sp.]
MADGDAKRFSIIRKGYSPEEVDEYIDELESKLSYYRTRNAELDQKLETARRLIKRFSASENDLRQNIADSKRAAAVMISETKDRCDTLLDKTRESCGEIISDLDMRVAEKMNTVDVMKASVAAFKDELFDLYSSHISLIESLARSAEEFTYEPDYTPVSDAVEDFEAQGEPRADAPVFEDYPEESIFEEVKAEEKQRENFVLNEAKAPAHAEVFTAPTREEKTAQTADDSVSEDGVFAFDTGANADGAEGEQEPEFETGDGFDDIFDDIDEISRAQSEAIAAAAAEQDAG